MLKINLALPSLSQYNASMNQEPESLVLQLLRDMRAEMSDMREQMATKRDVAELKAELKSDMHSLRADVASDLIKTRKELGEQIVGLRRAVVEYHTSVIGHGIIISEFEAREQHLDLPPLDTH
jgi:Mg2+ and Co2+ transporter CorA